MSILGPWRTARLIVRMLVFSFAASSASAAVSPVRAQVSAVGAPRPSPAAPTVDDLTPYTPIEVVDGAPGSHPLAVAIDPAVPVGFQRAQAYSDAHSGIAVLVWQGGKLRYEHYKAGFDENSRFETFSMHKSVLGLVYGAAIRDHVIASLDDKAGKYLEEWRNDPRGDITLRQLLSMQSGLRPFSFAKQEPQALEISSGHEVTKSALQSELVYPPGTRFEYNNANSQIAGAILNRALKASGRGDYAAYVSKILLKPLGAGDAHLWLEHDGGDPRFFAHFQMRARDWLRIGIMIDRKGRFGGRQIIPAEWLAQMETPSSTNPNYGLQVWLGSPWTRWRAYGPDNPFKVSHAQPYLVNDLVYFDGFGGERVYVSPSRDLVIVRIGQSDLGFDDSEIPNAILGGVQPPTPSSP